MNLLPPAFSRPWLPLLIGLGFLLLIPTRVDAEVKRIWLEARINNQPVRLIFDTGCDTHVLLRSTAERLKLKITDPPANAKAEPGGVLGGYTEICDLQLLAMRFETRFRVVSVPRMMNWDSDGVIGWGPLSNSVVKFEAATHKVTFGGKLPAETAAWQKFAIRPTAGCLVLEIPHPGGESGSVLIDTGATPEVRLSPKNWQKWKKANPTAAVTLTAFYMPATGLQVREVMLAPKLNLGAMELKNVLIVEADPSESFLHGSKNFDASLPLDILENRSLVIDGKNKTAYLSPKYISSGKLNYNRLGAVFVPSNLQAKDLIARVLPNSPAEKAGIRNGDILLRIGSYDATKWKTDPKGRFGPLLQQSAGTKIEFVLKRSGTIYKTTAVLRDILGSQKVTIPKR